MKETNNTIHRLKRTIDFGAARGHINSDLLYTVLMKYNRGRFGLTASELLVEAYKHFSPEIPMDITAVIDFRNKSQVFLERYEVRKKSDIRNIIADVPVKQETSLLEPAQKFFNFDAEDPEAVRMCDTLDIIRYRDRGIFVNKFLYQYFSSGKSDVYNDFCADRLLAWMKEEASFRAKFDTTLLRTVIDSIWRLSPNIEDIYTDYISEPEEEDMSQLERLKKAIGLL